MTPALLQGKRKRDDDDDDDPAAASDNEEDDEDDREGGEEAQHKNTASFSLNCVQMRGGSNGFHVKD